MAPTVEARRFQTPEEETLPPKLWQVYRDGFSQTATLSAQDQICYNEETFLQAIHDPEYEKFALFADGEPVGLSLLTTNFEKARIAYCDPAYYRAKFPKWFAAGRIYYVTSLVILPAFQYKNFSYPLVKAMTEHVYNTRTMVCFDYAESTNYLPDLILSGTVKAGYKFTGRVLDKQYYHVIHQTDDVPD